MDQRELLQRELNILRDRALLMGGEVELAIQRAVHALLQRDTAAADQVIERDSIIDQLELTLDQMAVDILTLRRPVGQQLRLVISVAKITPILERIADHASSVARVALELNDEPELNEFFDVGDIAGQVIEMLQQSLDAFSHNDADKARSIIALDSEIDHSYERTVNRIYDEMSRDAGRSPRLARLMLVAKHLERMGDYAKDICELTVYLKEAVFIKHQEQ
jgi:phosphate transport system protein